MTRKKDKGRRDIAAASKNLPVGPLVHQAADRVGPLAHDAADWIGPRAHDAGDRVGPVAHDAADWIGPFAVQAADRVAPAAQSAVDTVQPLARQAAERVQPYVQQSWDRVEPYAQQAAERIGPYASTAKTRGAKAAAEAVEWLSPKLDDAAGRIGPTVDRVRDRVQSDVLPAVTARLQDVAESASSVADETKKRLPVPVEAPKKRRWPKRLAIVAGVLAVGGAAFVAARKVLGGNEPDDWASRPATPYASTTITEPQQSKPETPAADGVAASASTAPRPDEVSEPQPAHAAEENGSSESSYGDGSYVGTEPPEGFTIKGNERSMKYHVSESSGYERTNADVWFNSEEAAESAGFTRAQR